MDIEILKRVLERDREKLFTKLSFLDPQNDADRDTFMRHMGELRQISKTMGVLLGRERK